MRYSDLAHNLILQLWMQTTIEMLMVDFTDLNTKHFCTFSNVPFALIFSSEI